MSVDLTKGYFFHPTIPYGGIQNQPFSSAAAAAAETCLKTYLKEIKANECEALHSFRSGCVITLALTGANLTEVMDHVGCTRRHMALYYLQLAKVLNPDGALARLASNNSTDVVTDWQDVNHLKRFVCAFPVDTLILQPYFADGN